MRLLRRNDEKKKNADDEFQKEILAAIKGENPTKALKEFSEHYKKMAIELHNQDQFSEALQNIRYSYVADILKDYQEPLPRDEKKYKLLIKRIQNREVKDKEVEKDPEENVTTARLLATESLILSNLEIQQTPFGRTPETKTAYARLDQAEKLLKDAKKEKEQKKLESTRRVVDRLFSRVSVENAPQSRIDLVTQARPIQRMSRVGQHVMLGRSGTSLMPAFTSSNGNSTERADQKPETEEKPLVEEGMDPSTESIEKCLKMREFFRDIEPGDKDFEYIHFYYEPFIRLKNKEQSLSKIIQELKNKHRDKNPKTVMANIALLKKYDKYLKRYERTRPITWPAELQNFLLGNPNRNNQSSIPHYYYAYLSWRVYRDYEKDQGIPETSKMKKPEELQKWKWEKLYPKDPKFFSKSEHYYGAAYYNSDINAVIIAHKGTSKAADFVADAYYALLNQMYSHFFVAIAFVKEVMENLQKEGKKNIFISHTGHSLGALLAEFSACTFGHPAITFDSPGSKRFLTQLAKENNTTAIEKTLERYKELITTYFAEPNFINVSDQHIGTLLRVYPRKLPNAQFQPPAEHVGSLKAQFWSAMAYNAMLHYFFSSKKYTATLLLSIMMLAIPRLFSLKRLSQSMLGATIVEEWKKPEFFTKLCLTWACAYYADDYAKVMANKIFTFFSRNESRDHQPDSFYIKLLFEFTKKLGFLFVITQLLKVTNPYIPIISTLLFMILTNLPPVQSELASFFERGQKALEALVSIVGGALGYTVSRRLLHLGQDVSANAKILLGESHSMKRILEIMEFSYMMEAPLLMSRIHSWPEGMLTGHSRVISIAQLIYQYNRDHVREYDLLLMSSFPENGEAKPYKLYLNLSNDGSGIVYKALVDGKTLENTILFQDINELKEEKLSELSEEELLQRFNAAKNSILAVTLKRGHTQEEDKIYDLDDFEHDISGNKKDTTTKEGKILKRYQHQVRSAIHYIAEPIRPLLPQLSSEEEKATTPISNQKFARRNAVSSTGLFAISHHREAEWVAPSTSTTVVRAKL